MALERSARPFAWQCIRCTRHNRIISMPTRTFRSSGIAREEKETPAGASLETQPTESKATEAKSTEVHPAAPTTQPTEAKSNVESAASETKPVEANGTETLSTDAKPASKKNQLTPYTASTPKQERKLMREQGKVPIGSRRRRAAIKSSQNVPFTELPYQCFQEARKYLLEDRKEKLKEIATERMRIARLQDKVVVDTKDQQEKDQRLRSMRNRLEHLKILADANDPVVKKNFEDGKADMNKPIYRHLADGKWREYKRKVLMQRIETMNVVPDVVAKIEPTVSTSLSFESPDSNATRYIQHGDIVDSRVSEHPGTLEIQKYERGRKLYTIAIINPDVPDVAKDGFVSRTHFLACNIPLEPTNSMVRLRKLKKDNQIVIPWLPAFAQKGLPYQRMSIFVLEQPAATKPAPGSSDVPPSEILDIAKLKGTRSEEELRKYWNVRTLQARFKLQPVGVDLFRTQWDEGTAGVMKRAGIIGGDVEFKRKRIEPLPYKRLKGERYR